MNKKPPRPAKAKSTRSVPRRKLGPFLRMVWDHKIVQKVETRTLTLADGTVSTRPFSFQLVNFTAVFLVFAVFWDMIVGAYFRKTSLWLFFRRVPNFFNILEKMVTTLEFSYLGNIIDPLIDTVQMAILGTAIGALLSLPVAFLASQNIVKNKAVSGFFKVFLSLVRTFPTLVYAAVLAFVFGYGTLVGVIATSIFTFGIMTKMLYEVIETLDLGGFVAIEATGASKVKAFVAAILPQIMGSFLSFSLYNFEINIRASAILGYVGAGGIGILLDENMSWREYGRIGVIMLTLFVVVILIENVSRYLRRRLS